LDYRSRSKNLVLHADDLGLSESVNEATLRALSCGWVSSASVMVPCRAFPSAAQYAQRHPKLDIGVHLTLTSEWSKHRWGPVSPASEVPSLVDADGFFWSNLNDFERHAELPEVEHEIHAQIRRAIESGISVSHVDTHMLALFSNPQLLTLMVKTARHYQLPCLIPPTRARQWGKTLAFAENNFVIDRVLTLLPGFVQRGSDKDHPLGDSANWRRMYTELLDRVEDGIAQLIVHLGYDCEDICSITLDEPYWGAEWRARDFDVVSSAAFRRELADRNIVLIQWKDLSGNRARCEIQDD
jgi:predicted glycoside hydrolase/deacetylase ChbG (UPF0249 family)